MNLAIVRGRQRPELLRDETLADILAATALRRPEHCALIWGSRAVTYGELKRASDTIAGALGRRSAGAGKIIGLMLPRGADLLITQAGITRSGAAWLPFDAETPLERVKKCLGSADAIGLVTCREWLPRFAELSIPAWAMEDLLAEENMGPPDTCAKSSDPAYVIYTSGSTGEPKGIAISQRGICHFLRSENEMLGVKEDDVVFQGFSVAFDMSFEEIWISYLVGATLWIAPPTLAADPDLFASTLTRERITVLHAVPTLMGLVSDPLPTLRMINLGGEACPDSLAQRLEAPRRKLFNTYGPTETSVSASLAELKPGQPVTIGTPLPNYGLLVVDEERRPVPFGTVGELCIFGPGLAMGYLRRDDLTAERFVRNPCAANVGEERMYLTGDLARIDTNGMAHCLGRADSQVKIRGFRVELDEINTTLGAQPGVATACVVVRRIAELDQVVAFVIPAFNQNLDSAQLRQSLASRLPHYMVPAHFEIVVELPRLPSGKIDTNALREIPLKTNPSAAKAAVPRNEEETALFAALEKLFPGQAFHSEADFFDDLGGHSLLVARLVSLLRKDSRYTSLGVQEIYRERLLGGIAGAMERQRRHKQPALAPMRRETPLRRRLFCGLAQAMVTPFFVLLHMADWLAPFFTYHYQGGKLSVMGGDLFSVVAGQPVYGVAGRVPAGGHAVDATLPSSTRGASGS